MLVPGPVQPAQTQNKVTGKSIMPHQHFQSHRRDLTTMVEGKGFGSEEETGRGRPKEEEEEVLHTGREGKDTD